MVFVAMCPAQQQPLPIQLEWPKVDEFGTADAEGLVRNLT
jgi:hypothetical protein